MNDDGKSAGYLDKPLGTHPEADMPFVALLNELKARKRRAQRGLVFWLVVQGLLVTAGVTWAIIGE